MNTYLIGGELIDSIDLKCLLTSKGVIVDDAVYDRFEQECRISRSPLELGALILSDGLAASLTDVGPFLDRIGVRYQWNDDEKRSYHPQLETPFRIRLVDDRAVLMFHDDYLDTVTFPPAVDFYGRTTETGTPFLSNISMQGLDFGTFAYLWPCEFAEAGEPCEYCHSGTETCRAAQRGEHRKGKLLSIADAAEMVKWGVEHAGMRSLMVTGGSTFDGRSESVHFEDYLAAFEKALGGHLPGDMVLYLTPPEDLSAIDRAIELGADKLGMSVEVWDEDLARQITPGKMRFTTRERHIEAWDYTAENFGPGYAFTNFILGIEPFESLERGVRAVAERGVFPGGSVWVPMGTQVGGKMTPPDIDFYRRCKELFYEVYRDNPDLVPACSMANGDIEPDIYRLVRFGDFREWKAR